jgi:hypothetical protein|tara:strand:+ start:1843 stop:2202 length:360 start_codon:yes stop_codon:yes gene_type:complete
MAGFALQRRNITLQFEGTELDGLEATCTLDLPLGTFLELQDQLNGNSEGGADSKTLRSAFSLFASEVLQSWNLEDENTGKPIPPDKKGIMTLSAPHASKLMSVYFSSVSEIPENLEGES